MTAGTDNAVIACCSFCLKPSTEVAKLVAGHGVYICNECVALCGEIIQAESRAQPSGPPAADPADPRTARRGWRHGSSKRRWTRSWPRCPGWRRQASRPRRT